ncbi:hypothetical protein RCL_jg23027.t1 [Rhizophagus clarus]|uniref:Uncharacterized protein n=1 Tax=Rhizophagus clarus TaxID=94130 RepID=A0A8H3QHN2_9GLOM|nr:hypothetical protein RCL_jg23027.t1 [Rhizophagus clarus]
MTFKSTPSKSRESKTQQQNISKYVHCINCHKRQISLLNDHLTNAEIFNLAYKTLINRHNECIFVLFCLLILFILG